jgi:hypothetical protein
VQAVSPTARIVKESDRCGIIRFVDQSYSGKIGEAFKSRWLKNLTDASIARTLPGGLGAAKISLAGMLALIVGLPREMAASAALLIRFFTLWFGVTLGFLVLALYRQRLFASQRTDAE